MAVKRIGILTSGGDAPGMNAAIRAAVRTAVARGATPFGILRGYRGMVEGQGRELSPRDVSNIIQRGGTILLTARCDEFLTEAGRQRAVANLRRWHLDGVILIGGDGTFRGGIELGKIWDGRIVGVPGTIDNDLYGTDYTIGFDTALNTALESIDKIRDTAEAHERVFIIEVMGRQSGFIALHTGIAGGAEEILLPETPTDLATVARDILADQAKGKRSSILVVAEGEEEGGGRTIAQKLKELAGIETRVSIIGHIQRGGSPTAFDRLLASTLGAYAVDSLLAGATGAMVGLVGRQRVLVPFAEAVGQKKSLDPYLVSLIRILAT